MQALRSAGLGGLLLICSLGSSGCVSSILADKIVRAPNRQKPPAALKPLFQFQQIMDRDFFSVTTKIHVEPYPADLSVAVIEPGDYKLQHELKFSNEREAEDSSRVADINFKFSLSVRDKNTPPLPPKATIVLLHGVMMSKESMLHWGFFLAQKGYRIVLIDLRGHGRSTGNIITYGARETNDLSQVLDELSRREIVVGRVGVLGLSYGGAIAIQWAARDPRITSVVALAPFSDARKAIDEFSHALMPKLMANISAGTMSAACATAAERGEFTWEQVDVLAAARQLRHPILIFHGARDDWVPPHHSEQIKAAAPAGSLLLIGPGNHITISLRLDPIAERVSDWFDGALTES